MNFLHGMSTMIFYVVASSNVRRKMMKKKKAGLILAALIAMGGVSAQAAITPDEQNQIVTAVLERLEKEKKIPTMCR